MKLIVLIALILALAQVKTEPDTAIQDQDGDQNKLDSNSGSQIVDQDQNNDDKEEETIDEDEDVEFDWDYEGYPTDEYSDYIQCFNENQDVCVNWTQMAYGDVSSFTFYLKSEFSWFVFGIGPDNSKGDVFLVENDGESNLTIKNCYLGGNEVLSCDENNLNWELTSGLEETEYNDQMYRTFSVIRNNQPTNEEYGLQVDSQENNILWAFGDSDTAIHGDFQTYTIVAPQIRYFYPGNQGEEDFPEDGDDYYYDDQGQDTEDDVEDHQDNEYDDDYTEIYNSGQISSIIALGILIALSTN